MSNSVARWTLKELVNAATAKVGGMQVSIVDETGLHRVWTDTRTLQPGDVFLPLKGPTFNGHDYLEQAFNSGCTAVFVSAALLHQHPEWLQLPRLLVVSEPLEAYLQLAQAYRQKLDPTVIALTGSSGKTTTKEMLFSALSSLTPTQKTEKNFNNEIGVSQTLLALKPETRLSIVEMGMRGRGQIDLLTHHAMPDIALITNVGPAHIEMLGSLEAIAQAKCELLNGLDPETGIAILNGDDTLLCDTAKVLWPKQGTGGHTLYYSLAAVQERQTLPEGERFKVQGHELQLGVTGDHMISNALAVLAVGQVLGYTVPQMIPGLEAFRPTEGRGSRIEVSGYPNRVGLTNDAYNANPASMRAALTAFLQQDEDRPPVAKILVLAGMNELGTFSRQYHQELGYWLKAKYSLGSDLTALFVLGADAEWIADAALGADFLVTASNSLEVLAAGLCAWLHTLSDPVEILLKGSRSYQLERLNDLLRV